MSEYNLAWIVLVASWIIVVMVIRHLVREWDKRLERLKKKDSLTPPLLSTCVSLEDIILILRID